jgi:hypothetical protein
MCLHSLLPKVYSILSFPKSSILCPWLTLVCAVTKGLFSYMVAGWLKESSVPWNCPWGQEFLNKQMTPILLSDSRSRQFEAVVNRNFYLNGNHHVLNNQKDRVWKLLRMKIGEQIEVNYKVSAWWQYQARIDIGDRVEVSTRNFCSSGTIPQCVL